MPPRGKKWVLKSHFQGIPKDSDLELQEYDTATLKNGVWFTILTAKMPRGKKWVLKSHFQGIPKDSDLELQEYDTATLKDGEFLLEAVFLTVDPYMRPFSSMLKIGDTMMGEQVARVIETKNPKFAVGSHVVVDGGWATHTVSDGTNVAKVDIPKGVPLSLALGVLGMPGRSAYFGLTEICNPKPGETVFVNGAAGAVGAVVGQIAKILGCRVVGCAGTDDKVAYLKELGFDEAFNYKKTTDLGESIKSAAPKGVDAFFDNVGGQFLATVINKNMNEFGRACLCGSISTYNAAEDVKVSSFSQAVVNKRIKIQGFVNYDHADKHHIAIKQLSEWVKQDKLKYQEHVTQGFENMYKAFMELFTGANRGKAIVKV